MITTHNTVDWDQIVTTWQPRLNRYFTNRGSDPHTAQDLTATTLMKAWSHIDRFSEEHGAFGSWLYGIARHVNADNYRHNRAQLTPIDEVTLLYRDEDVEQRIDHQQMLHHLHKRLQCLSKREARIIHLRFNEQLSYAEIAQRTDLKPAHVGQLIHRAILKLRHEWDNAD